MTQSKAIIQAHQESRHNLGMEHSRFCTSQRQKIEFMRKSYRYSIVHTDCAKRTKYELIVYASLYPSHPAT